MPYRGLAVVARPPESYPTSGRGTAPAGRARPQFPGREHDWNRYALEPAMKNPQDCAEAHAPAAAGAAEVSSLIEVMAKLRAEEGCPWDRKQTWSSLRRYVLEEAHELVDAVDGGDPAAVLEECGDLLLEVVFMAQIAHEEGRFGMAEVARGITRKLIRRHPHVFGDRAPASNAEEALASWEAIKAREKSARPTEGDRLPRGLPALLLAVKALERGKFSGAESGSDRDNIRPALTRMEAARRAGDPEKVEAALGDLLLSVARGAHEDGLDPESALRNAVRRLK